MRVIVAGGTEIAFHVARRLERKRHDVVLLAGRQEDAERATSRLERTLIMTGSATDPTVLEEAEARRADLLVALCAGDPESLLSCLLASRFFGVPRSVALVQDPDNSGLFRTLGVSSVVSSADVLGSIVEEQSGFSGIASHVALAGGRVGVAEVVLDRASPAVGRTLEQLRLPAGALIAAILREDAVIVPRGGAALAANDRLLVVSESDISATVLRLLVDDAS